MSATTGIAWTDATWTIVTGCESVGDGCRSCYAERLVNTRMIANPRSARYQKPFDIVICHEDRLGWPLHWRKPSRVFVSSLGDLFHRDVPDAFITRVFGIMVGCPHHTFQVLTKRAERMRRFVPRLLVGGVAQNIWLGTSIESNKYRGRAEELLATPAAVRFLSLEPLIGPVDRVSFDGVGWCIVGGESGPGHRIMDLGWLRDVVVRCAEREIPCFVKQDSGARPGQQGRISDDVWSLKQFPAPSVAA